MCKRWWGRRHWRRRRKYCGGRRRHWWRERRGSLSWRKHLKARALIRWEAEAWIHHWAESVDSRAEAEFQFCAEAVDWRAEEIVVQAGALLMWWTEAFDWGVKALIQCWADADIVFLRRIIGEEAEGLKTSGYGRGHCIELEAEMWWKTREVACYGVTIIMWRAERIGLGRGRGMDALDGVAEFLFFSIFLKFLFFGAKMRQSWEKTRFCFYFIIFYRNIISSKNASTEGDFLWLYNFNSV